MAKGWLRFSHLQARNIVGSWAQLRRLQEKHGFPAGRMISPNIRIWSEEEIDAYIAACPVEGPPMRGSARQKYERRLAAEAEAALAENQQQQQQPAPQAPTRAPRGPPRNPKNLDSTDTASA